jgi:uncharacterized membrane protein YqgA involved in biofilm formation
MVGTILNVAGILVGGIVGLVRRKPLTPANESFFKVALGVFTVWYGLKLTWLSLGDSFLLVLKQLLLIIVALMLGKMTGHLLRLQRLSNKLGRDARDLMSAGPGVGSGVKACAALFCAAPLGILGAVVDGLQSYFAPLAIKAVIDGLATMGFVKIFGWSPILSAVPVLALQGSIWLACHYVAQPFLATHGLIEPITGTAGLLIFSVALVILGIKKLELADYLPSLIFAPVLGWLLLKYLK